MAEGGANGGGAGRPPSPFRESPPKAVIDTSPILIDQNKESLKVKLLLRRPFDQLVAQGILPQHGQRRSVERAKTGDILKAKIQQRPPRQELERRHILEVEALHADPSLAERQRMLKKARLADQLNDQLSHRPGPLELIQKNILHTEEPIEEAVKTGKVPYKATSEGALKRPIHPQNYINPEEDSQGSSEGDMTVSPGPTDVLETAAKSAGIVVSLVQPNEGTVVLSTATPSTKDNNEIVFADFCRSVAGPSQVSASSPASLVSSTSTLSPLSSVASPVPSIASQPPTPVPVPPPPPPPISLSTRVIPAQGKTDAPGKDKNRKKSKSKAPQKQRPIKFHEYKGPPSAQKSNANQSASEVSSYDLLLQQQQLFLQLQLQHKYPQIILPASQKTSSENISKNNLVSSTSNANMQQPSPAPSASSESSTPGRITGRLEDMKVSDLKAELKRRSLPVSGSKPQLIERLKPYTSQCQVADTINQNPSSVDSSVHSSASMDQSHNSPTYQDLGSPHESLKDEQFERMEIGDPLSPAPQLQKITDSKQQDVGQKTNNDIVREQERQIEELRRELILSQLKVQALSNSRADVNASEVKTIPEVGRIMLQKHVQARQQHAQQQQNLTQQMRQLQALQAKQAQLNENEQRLLQQQHVAFQNQKNSPGLIFNNGQDTSRLVLSNGNAFLCQLMQAKNGHTRTNSLPNFITSIIDPSEIKREFIEEIKQPPEIKLEYTDITTSPKPPPLYEEATKQMNKKNKEDRVKSQIVDDVLDILIKNGELPPSAASYPSTPGSAGTKAQEPVYPSSNNINLDLQNNVQMIDTSSPDPSALPGIEFLDLDLDINTLVMELEGGCQPSNDNNNLQTEQEQNAVVVPMDTEDTDAWLETLMPSDASYHCNNVSNSVTSLDNHDQPSNDIGCHYDPLLSVAPDPYDIFSMDDFRTPDLSLPWDKVDYAA